MSGMLMDANRSLYIPVILGTARMGRMSQHAAWLVTEELGKCTGVETDLIDIAKLPLPTNDAGEAIKQADFSAKMNKADALVVVSPEYNHGYSGLLKHVLDSCLKEYIHKAVGIVGSIGGAVRWDPRNSEPAAGNARDWAGDDLLGCKFLKCSESVYQGRQAPRRVVHSAHR